MPKPKKPAAKPSSPAKHVPFATLVDLLGKPVDDPAVVKALASAGTVKTSSDFVVAKDAGFDFSLDVPDGAKKRKKVLTALFLFPEGGDGHRGYTDLPKGFAFSSRSELLAKLPEPATTWKIGPGKVPVNTDDVSWDQWNVDGLEVMASY